MWRIALILVGGLIACGGRETGAEPTTGTPLPVRVAPAATAAVTNDVTDGPAPVVQDHVPQGGACGRVTTVALDQQVSVLAGRYSMRFFHGGTAGPPSWDIMSAPKPPEEATRLWLMVGDRPHVALTFDEQFAVAGPSLEQAVAEYARRRHADGRIVRIHAADPALRVFGIVPDRCDLNDENAAVVIEAVIADGAGLVTTALVGVDGSELGDCGACTDRMVEALGTLTLGARAFATPAGEHALTGSRNWQVTVPEGWSLVSQPGPDFVWHRIRKPAVFPNPPALVALYDGDPPESELPPDARETGRSTASVAGRAGQWRLWTRPLPDLTVYGAFLSTRPALPLVVHVMSTVEADRDAGIAMVGSLRQAAR